MLRHQELLIAKMAKQLANIEEQERWMRDRNRKIEDNLTAMQCLDYDFGATGKIIIAVRTNQGDRVKIINIPPMATMSELARMVTEAEGMFGCRLAYCDLPRGFDQLRLLHRNRGRDKPLD